MCKVKDIEKTPSPGNSTKLRITVRLTMNPRDIVPDLVNHLFNGVVVPAAVTSIEDHGYAMEVGLEEKGIRAFLPKKGAVIDGEVNAPVLAEGQVILCAVESGGISNKNPTVRALQLNRNISAVRFLEKNVSPANLLPGAIVDVKVVSVRDLGLRIQCGSAQVKYSCVSIESTAFKTLKTMKKKIQLFNQPISSSQSINQSILVYNDEVDRSQSINQSTVHPFWVLFTGEIFSFSRGSFPDFISSITRTRHRTTRKARRFLRAFSTPIPSPSRPPSHWRHPFGTRKRGMRFPTMISTRASSWPMQ